MLREEVYSLLDESNGQVDWLKTCDVTSDVMRRAARLLQGVAFQLDYVFGANIPVKTLMSLSLDLETQSERLNKATAEKVTQDAAAAQALSGTMLKACLAGIFMAPGTSQETKDTLKPIIDHAEQVAQTKKGVASA